MSKNILQINEMIDAILDFIDNVKERRFFVGGIVGSQPFKYVINAILTKNDFRDICVIEGCQDFIGMTKHSILNNHFYYADLITEIKIPDFGNAEGFDHGYMVWNPMKIEYRYTIEFEYIGKFDYIIINDAQLIPPDILNVLMKSYPGKMIVIFDPFEAGAEHYIGYPTIVDSLSKLSAINAFARNVCGVSTRSIDKSVRCSVRESKVQRRSIGKNDSNQYVTDDRYLAEELWARQKIQPFRKGQRLWVTDTRIKTIKDSDGRSYSITKGTLLVVDTVPVKGKKLKLKIWNSRTVFESEVTYKNDDAIGVIRVRPANVILLDEVRYHKFPNMVLTLNGPITNRKAYVILKNSQNLVVGI